MTDISEEQYDYFVTHKVVRNAKLLLSIARGVPILNISWIEDCQKQNKFVQPLDKHYLDDKDYSKEWSNFNFKKAWQSKENKIFAEMVFWATPGAYKLLSQDYMRLIIEASGGELTDNKAESTHIVFEGGKKKTKTDQKLKQTFVELDFVFVSVMQQSLTDEFIL